MAVSGKIKPRPEKNEKEQDKKKEKKKVKDELDTYGNNKDS